MKWLTDKELEGVEARDVAHSMELRALLAELRVLRRVAAAVDGARWTGDWEACNKALGEWEAGQE